MKNDVRIEPVAAVIIAATDGLDPTPRATRQ